LEATQQHIHTLSSQLADLRDQMTEQRKHKQRIGQLEVFQPKSHYLFIIKISFADLDPDPYVFMPPGSYHQAKIVRKTLIPTVL
jgi:hypothetical protein